MAIIENPIPRKDRKKMGNIECYKWFGKWVIRAKPLEPKDAKTPAQLRCRARLKKLMPVLHEALDYINTAYAGSLKGKSAHNHIMSINLKNCFIDNTDFIDPSLFVLCDNDGSFVDHVVLSSALLNTITATFDSNVQNDDEGEDPVKAYGFYADGNKFWQFDQEAIRSTGTITLMNSEMSGLNIAVYLECLDRVNLLMEKPRHVIKYVGTVSVI